MSLTIVSARYANAEGTAAVITTQERGAVVVAAGERNVAEVADPWALFKAWEAAGNTVTAYVAPPATAKQRDLLAEIDALKAALVGRSILTAQDVAAVEVKAPA